MLTNASARPSRVLTYAEYCQRAGIVRRTFERLLACGEGPTVLHLSPRRRGVLEADFEAWLRSPAAARLRAMRPQARKPVDRWPLKATPGALVARTGSWIVIGGWLLTTVFLPQNPSFIKNNLARGSGASVSSSICTGSDRRRCFTY